MLAIMTWCSSIYRVPIHIGCLARNLQAVTEAVKFCYNEGTKSYAKELGFKTDLHPSWIFSELAYITQLPKEFDFEHPLLPPQFHYTGPFHDGKGRHLGLHGT
jgi:zeaxanthin glucosyltransferase